MDPAVPSFHPNMHADAPAFVPSRARRSSAAGSENAGPSNSIDAGSLNGQQNHGQAAHVAHAEDGQTPHARAASSGTSHSAHPPANHPKFDNGSNADGPRGHARSQSVPQGGHPSRGRGGSVPRGRGAPRGARGGSRGGHSGNVGNNIPVKRPVLPPPQPSVHLDSVDEFPALGGPQPSHHHTSTSSSTPTTTSTTSSSASSSADGVESTNGKTSPSLSLAESQHSFQQQPHAEGAMKKSQSISFARVVAPAPPPDPAPMQPVSASMSTGKGSQQQASTSSSSISAPSSDAYPSKSDNHNSSQSADSAPVHQHPARHPHPTHHNQLPYHSEDQDPLTVIPPEHIERPHFEPQPQPQAPTLTPLQLAFIEANGLSVEGLPNLVNAGVTAQSLPGYYNQQQGQQAVPAQSSSTSGIPRSTSTKALTKGEKNRLKKQREKEQQLWEAQQAQYLQQQQQHYYDYNYASAPQDQSESSGDGQYPAQGQRSEQDGVPSPSMGMQRSQSVGGTFHFSAAAPSFQPHHTHLSPSAPSFEPHHLDATRPKSPALNGQADEFRPHEEPVVEDQVAQESDEEVKEAIEEADEVFPDREERKDLPNGSSQEGYEENEVPKEGLDEESISTPPEEGAEVLDAKVEVEAIPEQETKEAETIDQMEDSTTATTEQEQDSPVTTTTTSTNEQPLEEQDKPSQAVIEEADADIPDRDARTDLPNGHSQEVYGADETPKPTSSTEEEDLLAPEDGGIEPATEASTSSAADMGKEQTAQGADVLDAKTEEEAIPEQENKNHEEEEIAEQMTEPTTATNDADLDDDAGEVSEEAAEEGQESTASTEEEGGQDQSTGEGPSSPPHSTFSLLPPVSVEDVLDKALNFVGLGSGGEEAKENEQAESEEMTETPTSHDAKANIDELDLPTDDQDTQAEEEEQTEAPTSHDAKSNIDELDLPTDDQDVQNSEVSGEAPTGDDPVANLDELDIPTIEADDLPAHSRESSAGSVPPEMDFSKASMSPSEVEETLMSGAEGGQALDEELATASRQTDKEEEETSRPEVISSSGERCTPWPDMDAETSAKAAEDQDTAGSQDGTEEADRSIRSAAPSPQPPTLELPQPSSSKSLSIAVPPVVISPSSPSPMTPARKSVYRPTPATPTTPAPLEDDSSKRLMTPPRLTRTASEAEKAEAIRLITELRSGQSTPGVEGSESETENKENVAPTAEAANDADTSFKFERTGKLAELGSSKRKRSTIGDRDNEGNGDDEDKKKEDKKLKQEEAPSLTLSIFSGSILPRKQLILSILASAGINIFLPFVNGVMLGFGEILARDWIGPWFGFGRRDGNSNASSRFSTSGLGLRNAGSTKRGGAQDVPGHAAAKTVVETVADQAL